MDMSAAAAYDDDLKWQPAIRKQVEPEATQYHHCDVGVFWALTHASLAPTISLSKLSKKSLTAQDTAELSRGVCELTANMETHTDVLLVTANVGSLFDNVSSLIIELKLKVHKAGLPEDYT